VGDFIEAGAERVRETTQREGERERESDRERESERGRVRVKTKERAEGYKRGRLCKDVAE